MNMYTHIMTYVFTCTHKLVFTFMFILMVVHMYICL